MQSDSTFCTSPGEAVRCIPTVALLDTALMENDGVPGYLIGEYTPSDCGVLLLVGHLLRHQELTTPGAPARYA